MKVHNAHEDIVIVGAACHRFDEVNVYVLCNLTAGMIRVAPRDNFTDLVHDAMGFIKVPTSLLATLVREVYLQEFQQIHSPFVQASKFRVRELMPTTANIPLYALDEDLNDLVTWVRDVQ